MIGSKNLNKKVDDVIESFLAMTQFLKGLTSQFDRLHRDVHKQGRFTALRLRILEQQVRELRERKIPVKIKK